jgi:hypothetical protein
LVCQARRAVDQRLGVGLTPDVCSDVRSERGALPVSGYAIRLGTSSGHGTTPSIET